jgi:hypothetical protein
VQKITKKASILIWAIFLSLIISVSFLSISTKITENLRNNSSNNKYINDKNEVEDKLKSTTKDSESILNKTIFVENKRFKKSLNKNGVYIIRFPKSSVVDIALTSS